MTLLPEAQHSLAQREDLHPLFKTFLLLAERMEVGSLLLTLPGGESHMLTGRKPGPSAVLSLHSPKAVTRLMQSGTLGFCESYLAGEWSSPDMTTLFELALRNEDHFEQVLSGKPMLRFFSYLSHCLRPNSKTGSQRNIMAHYDLGNNFYASWLDAHMAYSSAIYEDLAAPETLESAQRRKFARLAEMLQLEPGMTVLEIGCGWGGLAEYLARTHGVKVTAITISPAQFEYATQHLDKAGLREQVDVRLCDYRDIQGQYDRVVSVEMYEAVGEKYWPVYSRVLADCLKPGGRAALQVITIADRWWPSYRKGGDFIQRYIFPGGMLPTETLLQKNLEAFGLTVDESQSYGLHYARTLNEWRHRFQRVWPEITKDGQFDAHFKNMWDLYLCYCEAGFKVGTTDLVQLSLVKGQ